MSRPVDLVIKHQSSRGRRLGMLTKIERLMQLLYQRLRSPARYAATGLRISDVLGEGSRAVAELVKAPGAPATVIVSVIARAGLHQGIYRAGRVAFCQRGTVTVACSNVSGSMAAMTAGLMRGALADPVHGVQTGQPRFKCAYGMTCQLDQAPPRGRVRFNAAMPQAVTAVDPVLAQAADFSRA